MTTELAFDDETCHEIISQEWSQQDWCNIKAGVLMPLGPFFALQYMKEMRPELKGDLEYIIAGALRHAYIKARSN